MKTMYALKWKTKSGTEVTDQLYTVENVSHILEQLEMDGATDIVVESFVGEDERDYKLKKILERLPEKILLTVNALKNEYERAVRYNDNGKAKIRQGSIICGYLFALADMKYVNWLDGTRDILDAYMRGGK